MSKIQMPPVDETIIARKSEIVRALIALTDAECVVSEVYGTRVYETDGLTAYRQTPLAVVLPRNVEEVQAVLRYLNSENIKIVPRGAGTSLAGGALPLADSVVIGISKLNAILNIDLHNRVANVQAGVTNLAITRAVEAHGFFYAPDPSSQLACTIAGNIAMNSGGPHCLKYGVTTNNLLGVKMVLLDGTILELGSDALDSAGYDLMGLITGSEGQFGIVVEATVRLLHAPEGARAMLLGFNSCEQAGACVAAIIAAGIIPVAIEYMDKPAIVACENFAHAGYPLNVEAMLIIEVEGSNTEIELSFDHIETIAQQHDVQSLRKSTNAAQSAAIWKGRKSAYGAMGGLGDFICMDGTIPTSQLSFALKRISEICASYNLGVANIFHAGDGNLHPLVIFNANIEGELEKTEHCGEEILQLCVELGGCLTGEHGVGFEKRDMMPIQFSDADLRQQVAIKYLFDPKWLLNRGKVFPLQYQPNATL